LAVIGAVGVTASAYLNWLDDRAPWSEPTNMPLESVFGTELTETASSYWTSLAAPLAAVTLLAVLAAILRSRIVLVLGWLVGLATAIAWVVMRLADDTTDVGVGDLRSGFWVALLGLAVMLIGIMSMGPRPVTVAKDDEDEPLSVLDNELSEPPTPRTE
jgi:hypothetical protein